VIKLQTDVSFHTNLRFLRCQYRDPQSVQTVKYFRGHFLREIFCHDVSFPLPLSSTFSYVLLTSSSKVVIKFKKEAGSSDLTNYSISQYCCLSELLVITINCLQRLFLIWPEGNYETHRGSVC
jgi:hypothetical protein